MGKMPMPHQHTIDPSALFFQGLFDLFRQFSPGDLSHRNRDNQLLKFPIGQP